MLSKYVRDLLNTAVLEGYGEGLRIMEEKLEAEGYELLSDGFQHCYHLYKKGKRVAEAFRNKEGQTVKVDVYLD